MKEHYPPQIVSGCPLFPFSRITPGLDMSREFCNLDQIKTSRQLVLPGGLDGFSSKERPGEHVLYLIKGD